MLNQCICSRGVTGSTIMRHRRKLNAPSITTAHTGILSTLPEFYMSSSETVPDVRSSCYILVLFRSLLYQASTSLQSQRCHNASNIGFIENNGKNGDTPEWGCNSFLGDTIVCNKSCIVSVIVVLTLYYAQCKQTLHGAHWHACSRILVMCISKPGWNLQIHLKSATLACTRPPS